MEKYTIEDFGSFVFRSPKLSLDELEIQKFDVLLENVLDRKDILEAIFLSSPSLFHEIIKYSKGNYKSDKLRFSVLKYLVRMSHRCTPFGLMAGCGVGSISSKNEILVKGNIRKSRLDMDVSYKIVREIAKKDSVKEKLLYTLNTSVYVWGDNCRYIEQYIVNGRRTYNLSGVILDEYIQKIVSESEGYRTIEEIANSLCDDDVEYRDACDFVIELIDQQILVSNIELKAIGEDFQKDLIDELSRLNVSEDLLIDLNTIQDLLYQLDNGEVDFVDIHKQISGIVQNICGKTEIKNLIQVDYTYDSFQAQIDRKTVTDVKKGVDVLNRLTESRGNKTLDDFKRKFINRYDGRLVPLVEVLDVERGISFSGNGKSEMNDILEGISLNSEKELVDESLSISIEKQLNYNFKEELEIGDREVSKKAGKWEDLPETFNCFLEIGKKDGKQLIYLKSVGGRSATDLLGRFCYLNKGIYSLVEEIVDFEKDCFKDSIIAEIDHVPEARTGNVLLRPNLGRYEISYMSKKNVEKSIDISDLYITVDRRNTIILYSKKLRKRIIPRLSNAHNFSWSKLPIYHFLCLVQCDNKRNSLFFDISKFYRHPFFAPRLRYKNIIFSPATWTIDLKRNKISSFNDLSDFIVKYKLPQRIYIVDGDNKLYIDFEEEMLKSLFLHEVRNRRKVVIEEVLFDEEDQIVRVSKGSYLSEIIIPFKKNKF